MNTKMQKKFITNFNYKDIIIIFSCWYFIKTFYHLAATISFRYTPNLTGYFRLLIMSTGHLIFLGLIIFYLVSFYNPVFSEIGLKTKKIKKQLIPSLTILSFFWVVLLFFINIPLSFQQLTADFNPLYKITNPEILIYSLFFLLLLFIPVFIISLSEQFMLNSMIFELFDYVFPTIFAVLLSSFFYSILLLEFKPQFILINLLIGCISIFLYLKSRRSLFMPTIFKTVFYSFYICYVYGWDLLF